MQYLPIIYVRGYAGTDQDVDQTVNDPFYGFNSGSTHIRVGEKGTPEKFFFESPLLRLITDHGYRPVFDNKQLSSNIKTIWIYRFYDMTSPSFGEEKTVRLEMEEIAEGLRDLINVVKKESGANKVYLIAHSMGGLVCRSLIQKIYPDHNEKAEDHIDKLFTYGTPHGGIYFQVGGGLIEGIRDTLRWNNSDDFGPQRMYEYFTPKVKLAPDLPQNFDTQSLDNAFSPDRVFCIIGTNARDYENGAGLSQKAVGPQSDGLVQIDKAYVRGAHRAYIHRTHGGRYGMVNSEEAYQNLQRFLFGDIKVKLSLSNVELIDSKNTFYQMEVRVALRGLPTPIHEQAIDRYCPITVELMRDKPVPLFTAFLIPRYAVNADNTCRYAIRLALHSFTKKERDWLFDSHIDQLPLWSDYLIVDVTAEDNIYKAKYCWNSESLEPNIDLILGADILLPQRGRDVVGAESAIKLEISQWQ
ncbi:alpha/beta hydrolase [Nostoc sp. FACHB-87]|uniref:esterase/lipase family protein n=1 Tax=Nostocaceae TaxID=1162 RepID=UPI001686BE1F|nr:MULTISPECIES: alpha/beta hydrolase [Nostocaceae]MBD2454773.1 alpha/beta hydrolase [Nostoc sp. FACHB-87]MBD2476770.1 alpha/beta hydrolase [Anabaena sp. FACHB-83]